MNRYLPVWPVLTLTLLVTPAFSSDDGWRLMSRHGECAEMAALERKITVGADGVSLGVIRISESGYVAVPHKNKHGKEYPPPADEHVVYPGGRR